MTPEVHASATPVGDLAGTLYWDRLWRRSAGQRVDLRSYYAYRLARLFRRFVAPGARVLEVGCGGSVWLPYLADRHGAEVWGVDYSPAGVALARANLAAAGVAGTVVFGDAFDAPQVPRRSFDVVWSNGFVEHFADVAAAVAALACYLRPGGIMITLVPNLEGGVGWLHRVIDPEVYAAHVRVSPRLLDHAHRRAGLRGVAPARFFGVFSLGVVNFTRLRRRLPARLDAVLWRTLVGIQQAVCLPWRLLHVAPESRLLSPYVVGVYQAGP